MLMKIIKSILFNIFFTSVLFASNNVDIFTIHDGNPEIVQSKYMKYLEVPDHDISYNELKIVNGEIICKVSNQCITVSGLR